MISEKIEHVISSNESNAAATNKPNKWNEQPHIGKYKLIKTIGKGNFAKVKLAQHVTTGKKVAVKVIDKTALNTSSLNKLFREVKIMKTLDHPNIVKLFEVIESERHVYLVMEYAPKGEVFDYLVQNGRMKEKEARQRFREIVSAIQYCHQKNIVHRDLKAENLLLGNDNQIKIADFGFANLYDPKKQLDTFCGSPPYAAPELFQGRKYEGPEVDVWSLGVILYTLVSGSLPFDGHNMRELRERVLRGKYRIPFYMTTDCEMLLKKMLVVNPLKRSTLLEVMRDKWINMGFEDSSLKPFLEPQRNFEDSVKLAVMETLGFSKDEVLDSLYNAKFNNVTATYLLLDYELSSPTPAEPNSAKYDSASSLKNVSSYQNTTATVAAKNLIVSNTPNDSSSSKGIARSGSAVESRTSNKVSNGGTAAATTGGTVVLPGPSLEQEKAGGSSGLTATASMRLTPGGNQQQQPPVKSGSIRLPGIQPSAAVSTGGRDRTAELSNGDNNQLLLPGTAVVKGPPVAGAHISGTSVKRNNTFTYADKNTTSEVEAKPVTRTRNMMNMLSHVTAATVPISIEQVNMPHSNKKHGATDPNSKTSRSKDQKTSRTAPGTSATTTDDVSKSSDSAYEQAVAELSQRVGDKPSATGDRLPSASQMVVGAQTSPPVTSTTTMTATTTNTLSSNDSNMLMLAASDDNKLTSPAGNAQPDCSSISGDKAPSVAHTYVPATSEPPQLQSTDHDQAILNHQTLNKPRQLHSSSLFRSFTSKISSNKLIRRLTSQNPPTNRNKRLTDPGFDNEQPQLNSDPWTPMNSSANTDPPRKISASSELNGVDKRSDYNKAGRNTLPHLHKTTATASSSSSQQQQAGSGTMVSSTANTDKPRLMHLLFRKSITSKLRPEAVVTETMRCLQPLLVGPDSGQQDTGLELTRLLQRSAFVVEVTARLQQQLEPIDLEIEVFRLSRGSGGPHGVRLKKVHGSSTRFKAVTRLLVTHLTPPLSRPPSELHA